MPLTALTVITSARLSGAVLPATGGTAADVANGNSFVNDGKTLVLATNSGSTVVRNVTVTVAQQVDGQQPPAKPYVIPIGVCWVLGPYDPATYGAITQINGDNAELKFNVVRLGQA